VFDIIKPSFVGWADRSLKGAHGVMFDDVLAGICAAIVWYPIIMISYGVKAYVS
jgi:phosphatidylglycerophosphatase A